MVKPPVPLIGRLAVALSTSLLVIQATLLLAAGDHPSAPQQPQSQQIPQTTSSSQSAGKTMPANMAEISSGLQKFIDNYAGKSADKKFHMPYRGKDLALELVKVHDDRLSGLGAGKYFACVDMKGSDGRLYDIDFSMVLRPGKLTVTETSVHKINGKPLYNWKEEGGVWKKVGVS